MDLAGVADELYALAPEDFTSARDTAARAQDDRAVRAQVTGLRKPTVSAWVVNLLARAEPVLLEQLTGLGESLADAQQAGAGEALRELGAQRRTLVSAVAARAVELAGRPLTATVRAEVEATLEAALSDPAYGEAVRSGRLVRPLSYAGFGDPDLVGAVAVPAAMEKGRAAELARREADALQAAGTLDDAVRAAERAERTASAAADEVGAAGQAVDEAGKRLEAARVRRTQVEEAHAAAAREADVACDRVAEAQREAERTRAALDALRREKG